MLVPRPIPLIGLNEPYPAASIAGRRFFGAKSTRGSVEIGAVFASSRNNRAVTGELANSLVPTASY